MLTFALKNMAVKKAQMALIILSIVLSAGVGVLSYNVGQQVSDGITGSAAYYSVIIGPAGSQTQLAMNSMYFADEPLGVFPYAVVGELARDRRVALAVPFAMADSFNGYSCVGTSAAYLDGKKLSKGVMFDDGECLQAVVGANVAEACGLSVGDELYTSHSAGDTHATPLTVVGILERSHTAFDNIVFTEIKTLWEVHEHEEEAAGAHEEHDHETGMVCAVLVRTTNPATAMTLVNEYNGKLFTDSDGDVFPLQAIEPMHTVRGVLEDTDNTKYIVFALCAIILVMNAIIISVITLLNMVHSAKEIALMRLIGISMRRINLLYIIQNGVIGLISIALAFGLSRACLSLAQRYVQSMGVFLNLGKVYGAEGLILLGVFIISVLPTIVLTGIMSRRDGISE